MASFEDTTDQQGLGRTGGNLVKTPVAGEESDTTQGVPVHEPGGGSEERTIEIPGELPVLPQHYWKDRDFKATTFTPPLGSGPYRISNVQPGRQLVFERVKDYWGKNLPVNRGFNNFNRVEVEFYRDSDVAFEAFKAGEYDIRVENEARKWATGYTGPAVDAGHIRKEEIPHEIPPGMQAYVFNTKRPVFQDRRVRMALNYMMDFEWMNRNLFYDQYTRTRSYFQNTEFAATGLPSRQEREILEPIREKIPGEVFTREYNPPVTDGSGNIRRQIREALSAQQEGGRSKLLGEVKKQIGAAHAIILPSCGRSHGLMTRTDL